MAGAEQEGVARTRSCQFKMANGELCRRRTNEGTFCWQHSRGCQRRWRALTRNQSVLFVLACIGAMGVAFAVIPWVSRSVRQQWAPTFVYLAPSRELIDCERRAFFVNRSGSEDPKNLHIVIKDNRSGTVQENDDFRDGIEPGPQNLDAPRYIWVKPSRPWDEDYTITVTGTNFRSVQNMVLRSVNKTLQSAVQVTVDSARKPVVSCRDSSLPQTYSLGLGSRENCKILMAVDPTLLIKLQPQFYGFQQPNGAFTAVRLRKLAPASDLDAHSEDRDLTEYQQTVMKAKLSKYHGTKLLILYAGGPKTLSFAKSFRKFLGSLGWYVEGPRFVPAGDEEIVDVQISVSSRYWNRPYSRAADLLSSLQGVKHRQAYVYDDAVPTDRIVLWVGPKSPENFRPDDCAPPALRPRLGEHHTCEMVSQTISPCPFPPQ